MNTWTMDRTVLELKFDFIVGWMIPHFLRFIARTNGLWLGHRTVHCIHIKTEEFFIRAWYRNNGHWSLDADKNDFWVSAKWNKRKNERIQHSFAYYCYRSINCRLQVNILRSKRCPHCVWLSNWSKFPSSSRNAVSNCILSIKRNNLKKRPSSHSTWTANRLLFVLHSVFFFPSDSFRLHRFASLALAKLLIFNWESNAAAAATHK